MTCPRCSGVIFPLPLKKIQHAGDQTTFTIGCLKCKSQFLVQVTALEYPQEKNQ